MQQRHHSEHGTLIGSTDRPRVRPRRPRHAHRLWDGTSRAFLTAGSGALLALAVSTLHTRADVPLRWRWSNPRPHGGNIVDMVYVPYFGLTVQVAELGQIYSSIDLNFWVPRESGTTNDLRAVAFLPHPAYRRLLVTGANGTVLYADDPAEFHAGTLTTGPTTDWLEAVTSSPALAVAVGDNGAIYTSANGAQWARQNSGTAQWLRGVAWGGGVFVAAGENGKLLISTNGT